MRYKIIGPPGTGKTTYGLDRVDEHLLKGLRVGYQSFTNQAVNEAINRALKREVASDDLVWFRTIHSACYKLLDMKQDGFVSDFALKAFGSQVKPWLTFSKLDTRLEITEPSLKTRGDELLAHDHWCRHMLYSIEEGAAKANLRHFTVKELEDFSYKYHIWKLEHDDLLDFTDMLSAVLFRELVIPVDVLITDESQDNSPLLDGVLGLWNDRVETSYRIGDSDQAIYSFMGAAPDLFDRWQADEEVVLDKSYRLPKEVRDAAINMIRRNANRKDITYEHNGRTGFVKFVRFWDLDFKALAEEAKREGEGVYLLARNRMFLVDYPKNGARVKTIHGSKGGQALYVVIRPEMTTMTFDGWIMDTEAERRVWYVALTRSKKGVYITEPRQPKNINLRREITWPE